MTRPNLLAFMTDATDKYDVPKPTEEQLAAVLPWLVDAAIRYARDVGHCSEVNDAMTEILGGFSGSTEVEKYYDSDGCDCEGFDRGGFDSEGYNRDGYNAEGYNSNGRNVAGFNKDGFNRYGYDKDGFDHTGRNDMGQTRQQAAEVTVKKWTNEYLVLVAAKLKEREAAKVAG